MLQVSYWLQPIAPLWNRLPSQSSLRRFIAREQLLEPFRSLVGSHFAGRRSELNVLSDYVGVLEASSFGASAVRTFEKIFSLVKSPPLFLLGPGGVGKSTLIAKFVLEHLDASGVAQFPYAYLDFDRAALMAEEPITLLFEVMRQLAVQYADSTERYRALVRNWGEQMRIREVPLAEGSFTKTDDDAISMDEAWEPQEEIPDKRQVEDAPEGFFTKTDDDAIAMEEAWEPQEDISDKQEIEDVAAKVSPTGWYIVLAEFADFVQQLQPNSPDIPLLLVLDTFEEVQFRSSASEDDVFNFLAQLQECIPTLRTVICGRTEITSTSYKVKELKVENFDKDAAIAFLVMQGIQNKDLAARIVTQVGTSPLVLRLAAEVARSEDAGSGGIEGLGSKWLSLFRGETVEVVLYKRILAHVYDRRVQQMANPGLVLRFITPEVLLGVLGPACGVPIAGISDARTLVVAMRKQLATILVPHGGTEKLAHRPDMRAILLADLTARSKKEEGTASLLQKIHSMAVSFYSQYDDDESRAEELFHRLWLREDRSILKARWRDGAGLYLGSGILELSPEGQAFVAGRAGFEVSEEVWNSAAEEDWELLAARRVRDLVRLGKPQAASALLIQRAGRVPFSSMDPPYARMIEDVLSGYARHYELIRNQHDSGDVRTRLMNGIMGNLRGFADALQLDANYALTAFAGDSDGDRIVGLALAQTSPQRADIASAIQAIGNARTPFEQYQGLVLAEMFHEISPQQQVDLRRALLEPSGTPFHSSDRSRINPRNRLLKRWPEPEQETDYR